MVKTKTMNAIDISKLSNQEKIKLIPEIHESMDTIGLSDAVKTVLDSRIERIESGPAKFFTLEELVFKKILKT